MSRATALRVLLVLALVAAALACPAGALAQTDPGAPPDATATATAPSGESAAPSGPGLMELLSPLVERITDFMLDHLLVNLLQVIAVLLHKVVDAVLGSSLNFVTRTPPAASYDSPTVRALAGAVRGIANAALALVALWGGLNLIVRPRIGAPYHEAMELFPRLVLGALLVNTADWWTRLAIDANNALCGAIGQTSLPAWDRADTGARLVADLIAVVVYLVVGLLLVLQQLMRLALVDVLLVLAPLALLCWVLPQTGGYARLWCNTFVSTVFAQFAQVVALKVGASLVTELQPMAIDAAAVADFLGVAVMLLALKVPDLMRGQLGDGLGFARFYAFTRGARALDQGGAPAGRAGK